MTKDNTPKPMSPAEISETVEIAKNHVLFLTIQRRSMNIAPKARAALDFLQAYVDWAEEIALQPNATYENTGSFGSVTWDAHGYAVAGLRAVMRCENKVVGARISEVKGLNSLWAGLETPLRVLGDL